MASFRPSYCTISTYHRLITCLQVGLPLQPVRTGRDAGPAAAAWSAGRDRSCVLPSHKSRGCALDLGGLTCDGDVFLNGEFHADGQVRLTRATIQRELNCSKGTFSDLGPFTDPRRSPRALDAEGLTTAGSVYLNEFRADGEVFLFRSNIAQQLDCAGGTIVNPGRIALDLSGARIYWDVRLISGFRAVGETRLSHTAVGQYLDCLGGESEVCANETALNASGMRVAGSFIWLPAKTPVGLVNLSFASAGRLVDTPSKWPTEQHVELTGVGSAGVTCMNLIAHARHPVCGPSRTGGHRHDLTRLIWLVAAVREESWSWSRGGEARAAGHRSAYWAPMLSALLVTE